MKTDHKDITVGSIPAYHAYPTDGGKHPGLIVIHEIWGLDAHTKDVANRFAAEGYSVLAPNLFHGLSFEGKVQPSLLNDMQDPAKRDEAQKKMREVMAPMEAPGFAEDMLNRLEGCLEYLLKDAQVNGSLGVIGFCFGGTYASELAAKDSRIKAVLPFYGQPLPADKVPNLKAPMLAFYGEQDERLIASLPALKESMKKNGKDFEAIVYPNTGHAFFNDTNKNRYNEAAAKDSWQKTLAFLKKNL